MKPILYVLLLPIIALALPPQTQSNTSPKAGNEATHLAPHTPIATRGETIYAVSAGGGTVLQRTITNREWTPVAIPHHFRQISGLSVSGDDLFIVDALEPAVYLVSLKDFQPQPLHVGPPLQQPSEISVVGDHVFVLDRAEPVLLDMFRGEVTRVEFKSGLPISRGTYLGSFGDSLVVAAPDQGAILVLSHVTSETEGTLTELVCKDPRCLTSVNKSPVEPLTDVLPQTEKIDRIRHPGSVALAEGIVYFVDRGNASVAASSSRVFRPVELLFSDHRVKRPGRIALTSTSIVILDDSTNDVAIWPLLVPAEIVVDVKTSESLSAIYGYLFRNNILPTKITGLDDSVEKTLRNERALLSPYVPSLDIVICGLNPTLCKNGSVKRTLRDQTPIVVPNLYSESYIDAMVLKLDGTHALKKDVDRSIRSPELGLWKTEQKLRQMNPQFKRKVLSIRDQRNGTFIIPVEHVRYVAAVLDRDLEKPTSDLSAVASRHKSLTVHSLQEVQAVPQQDAVKALMVKKDKSSFQDAYDRMLRTINYIHPNGGRIPYIGVAEKDIECENPDFEQSVCMENPDVLQSIPQSAAVNAIQKFSDRFRDFDKLDHGTAIAAIIGARHTDFSGKGLIAPEARVVPLSTEDTELGEDIRKAFNVRNAHIFNLSLSFKEGQIPKTLAKYMSGSPSAAAYRAAALFIISAPDDGKPVCGERVVYPICWGLQPNVLVVAGSLIDGSGLIPNDGGSNWGKAYVHVAAPGVGFGVSGRNGNYVPIAGTSFAAPLVTATAALLYEQNIDNPVLIKQRIIATSDPVSGYEDRVFGGLLNVSLAVSNPKRGLLVDEHKNTKVIDVVPGQFLYIVWSSGSITLPLQNVLRLTRRGDGYRIVYQDPSETTQLRIQDDVSYEAKRPWKIQYSVVSEGQTRNQGKIITNVLSDYRDYVGPIP